MDLTLDNMKSKTIQNPLLRSKMELELDTGTVQINLRNITKFFRKAYVLTPFRNESYMEELNTQSINIDMWKSLSKNLVLHETNIKILGNFTHSHNIVIGKSCDFSVFNHFNYELTENVLIIPILNISYLNITKYLQVLYEGSTTLEDLYNILLTNQESSKNDELTYNGKMNLTSTIKNLEESKYWTKRYNCLLNITKLFHCRQLRFSNLDKITDSDKKKLIQELVKENADSNYLTNIKGSKNFVDASSAITNQGYKLYRISRPCDMSKSDINGMFTKLNSTQKFYMFCNLLVSKKYCHLAINNYDIMKEMKSTIDYFPGMFKYYFGYAWLRFYMEEGIKKTWMKKDDEFVFDINTASLLPVYPFSIDDPKSNPYMPILIADRVLDSNRNLGGLAFYNTTDSNFINQGITDLDGFKRRMNLFISGNSSNDIFMNMDWKNVGAGVSGSIMTACLQKRHQLVTLFAGKNNFNQYSEFDMDYNRYFHELYPEADVDIMISSSHPVDFMEKAKTIFNQVVVNICGFNPQNAEPCHVKMKTIQTIFLFVDEQFIKDNIVDESLSYEKIVTNLGDKEILNKFMPFIEIKVDDFYKEKFSEYDLSKLKITHPELFAIDSTEVFFQIHLTHNNSKTTTESDKTTESGTTTTESGTSDNVIEFDMDDESEETFEEPIISLPNVGINISYKVKISSIHIQRQLELFSLFGDDFFALVSKFHMPCVRAYYDGDNVYMTPSCISAHLTYMNIDYKYFAGSKDPIEIILKYRMRGFGTFLNKNEISRTLKYVSKVQFWNNLHNINLEDKNTINSFLGSVPMNSKLFQPRIYNQELFGPEVPFVNLVDGYNNIPNSLELLTYKTHANFIKNNFHTDCAEDFPNVKYINNEGYIVPVKKWLIESTFNNARYNYLQKCKKEKEEKERLTINTNNSMDNIPSPPPPVYSSNNNTWSSIQNIPNSWDEEVIVDDE